MSAGFPKLLAALYISNNISSIYLAGYIDLKPFLCLMLQGLGLQRLHALLNVFFCTEALHNECKSIPFFLCTRIHKSWSQCWCSSISFLNPQVMQCWCSSFLSPVSTSLVINVDAPHSPLLDPQVMCQCWYSSILSYVLKSCHGNALPSPVLYPAYAKTWKPKLLNICTDRQNKNQLSQWCDVYWIVMPKWHVSSHLMEDFRQYSTIHHVFWWQKCIWTCVYKSNTTVPSSVNLTPLIFLFLLTLFYHREIRHALPVSFSFCFSLLP